MLAVVQGGLIGKLTTRYGSHRLFQVGVVGFALAMLGTIVAGELSSFYGAMAAMALQSGAAALVLTSMQSLVSQCAAPTERGMLMGVYSSASALGRVLGTLVTGVVFARVHIESPFALAFLTILCLFFLARIIESRWQLHRG